MLHRAGTAAFCAAMLSFTHVATAEGPTKSAADPPLGCLTAGGGYLRARVRGALELDLNWKNAEMQCAGGPRPSGNGVRVSIGGPLRGGSLASQGDHRVAMAFAIAGQMCEGEVQVCDTANVATSFPGFVALARTAGMALDET